MTKYGGWVYKTVSVWVEFDDTDINDGDTPQDTLSNCVSDGNVNWSSGTTDIDIGSVEEISSSKTIYMPQELYFNEGWSDIGNNEYDTKEEAQEALMYHLRSMEQAVYFGELESYDADQWRIIKIEVVS